MADVELVEQRIELLLALRLVGLDHLEHGADIGLDRQAAKDRRFLRQVADAEPRPPVHRHRRDVVAVELDRALVGLHQPGDHVEDRRLARPVRPEQADRLAARHREARVMDDLPSAIGLGEVVGDEPAPSAGFRHQARRRQRAPLRRALPGRLRLPVGLLVTAVVVRARGVFRLAGSVFAAGVVLGRLVIADPLVILRRRIVGAAFVVLGAGIVPRFLLPARMSVAGLGLGLAPEGTCEAQARKLPLPDHRR